MAKLRSILSHPAAPSLWADTAVAAPATPALEQSIQVDVLVVGAGYTGLSAALYLARAGARVCVLDAREPGWGASGRNGGQVNPTLKHDPDDLRRLLGPARAQALMAAVSGSADRVFRLIEECRIDCQPVRRGWVQAGYTEQAVAALHARARQWEQLGVPVEILDRRAVGERIGSTVFAGGWLDGRAGAVQPLSLARGLAQAALAAGAAIHGHSPVLQLSRQGAQWEAVTAGGARVRAAQVLLATNGYTDGLWPGLAQTVLAANSFIVATRPLGEAARAILPGGQTASTSQRLLLYFRKDAEGRLLMGGRGHFADPAGARDFAHLERALQQMFPQLGAPTIDYRWAGRVAITQDFLPHLHQPAAGVTMALGYNGRGIATAISMGWQVSELLMGKPARDCPFPISPIQPIPLHGLQRFYVAAGVAWYSLLDRLSR